MHSPFCHFHQHKNTRKGSFEACKHSSRQQNLIALGKNEQNIEGLTQKVTPYIVDKNNCGSKVLPIIFNYQFKIKTWKKKLKLIKLVCKKVSVFNYLLGAMHDFSLYENGNRDNALISLIT